MSKDPFVFARARARRRNTAIEYVKVLISKNTEYMITQREIEKRDLVWDYSFVAVEFTSEQRYVRLCIATNKCDFVSERADTDAYEYYEITKLLCNESDGGLLRAEFVNCVIDAVNTSGYYCDRAELRMSEGNLLVHVGIFYTDYVEDNEELGLKKMPTVEETFE